MHAETFADRLGDSLGQVAQLIALGGPVVLALLLLSVVALAIVLLKVWQLTRLGGREATERALAAWAHDDREGAIRALEGDPSPVAELVRLAIGGLARRDIALERLREEIERVGAARLESLGAYLRPLEVIGGLSPLLGLLGTVLGMIEAFQNLESAGTQVDPAILSGGIWQALLTTAVGLAVAIPTVLAHALLERQVERWRHVMEDAVTRVFTRGVHEPPPEVARLHPGHAV